MASKEPDRYAVVRHDGHTISVHDSTEAAGWAIMAYHAGKPEWYAVEPYSVLRWLFETPKLQRPARYKMWKQATGQVPYQKVERGEWNGK